jgi:DNA-binding Lrp family transcriptional regulator
MLAYILINCIPKSEEDIISEITKLSEVVEVNGIMGKYDIFVKVTSENPEGIDSTIKKIRSINGITFTYTMPVIYGQGGTIDKES